jgi:hypothetical protein
LDAAVIHQWLLRYGEASNELQKVSAEFTSWLANELSPWAAYRALWSGRLVALDKSPGICPVRIGEAWMRCDSKCVLSVAGGKARDECGVDQLCTGLEAGVEGGIHTLKLIWKLHAQEEEWGFLLVDPQIAFKKGTRKKCVGPSDMRGPLVHGMYLIATATGRSLWSEPETATLLSFLVRKA